MSILLILDALVANGKLIERPSAFTGFETARAMYVSPEISGLTTFPFPDTEEGQRFGEFAAWLDAFSEHGEISVSQNPDQKPQDTMLARVHPVAAEFWSIRVTEPQDTPGIRALGAFVRKDAFVALTWDFREDIDVFDEAVAAARAVWGDLFGHVLPFAGSSLSDYLSNFWET